ncbi:hypothetical protein [Algoriphagus hitonicola]|uniref:Uncharacterized protein n=1 Tax=Algoriphagus hitonicola TaxID=435880 RepID=A0A1I2UXR0_9BACT|nr:hypothetical protein [Algoriphagus hitonicola]SFG80969.1 hypothetical protein SAMN04487988_108152 [Algoriphagus hitonicola]
METIIVKVDTEENRAYLKEFLLRFNFVREVDGEPIPLEKEKSESKNVAGTLQSYADSTKLKEEELVWEKIVKEKHGTH